ncbi:MAG: PorP/SprF family type IX secretion system membrane protein [Chitinophagia bacterium]|jgi:type IX secretion system PorP/SprF family membrane protein
MKNLIVIILLLLKSIYSVAQDYHFSQINSIPLFINPANTGNFSGDLRILSNYRSQWQGIGEPYQTATFSTDFSILKNKLNYENKVAIGVAALFDKSSGGLLKSNHISASLAYHLFFDKTKINKLSFGFQSSIINKLIDIQNVSFASQFSSNGFNLSIPSNQFFTGNQKSYFDLSAGLNFDHSQDDYSISFGIGLYHLNNPEYSFLGVSNYNIPLRVNYNFGGSIALGLNGKLFGSVLYSQMSSESDALVGLMYAHDLSNSYHDIQFRIGSSFRVNESYIPYIGYVYDRMHIGFSYDIVNPYLINYSNINRSLELSVGFQLSDKSSIRKAIPWY